VLTLARAPPNLIMRNELCLGLQFEQVILMCLNHQHIERQHNRPTCFDVRELQMKCAEPVSTYDNWSEGLDACIIQRCYASCNNVILVGDCSCCCL